MWSILLLLLPVAPGLAVGRPVVQGPDGLHQEGAAAEREELARAVAPLLSDRCYPCHGPGVERPAAGLRLDLPERARAARDGRAAIVPGDADASELVRRVRGPDPGLRMPPPDSHLSLDEHEIGLLVRWIEAGAPTARHWAFVPPTRRRPPTAAELGAAGESHVEWARDELDRWVMAGLARAGLAPAPEADRSTWLRRVTFDLTGLPPTLDELDRFLADDGPEAHARVVDRLLESPAHAERMTALWLDVARYADTYGYQADVEREVWPWRDWVLDAHARNLPYDEFLTWQLAGDLLPDATREQRLATAFQRLHRQTNEGGSTEEEYRVEYVADRVQTLGTGFLGLTLQCARCHDHKFDPISQREYTGVFALLDDIDESGLYSHFTDAVPTPALDLPTPEQERELERLERAVREAELVLEASGGAGGTSGVRLEVHHRFDAVDPEPPRERSPAPDAPVPEEEAPAPPAPVVADGVRSVEGARGAGLAFSGDDPVHLPGVGHFHRSDPFTLGLHLWLPRTYERAVVLHRSRAWTDSGSRGYELLIEDGRASAALVHFWPGDAVRVRTRRPLPLERWVQVTWTHDGSGRARGLRLYVDGRPAEVEVVRDGLTRTILGGGIEHLTLGERFRDHGLRDGRLDEVVVIRGALGPEDVARLARGEWRAPATTEGDSAEALEALRRARRARDEARDRVRQVMTMRALPEPRTAHLLERGEYDHPAEAVEPHLPAVLPPLDPTRAPDRLALARSLTRPDHPLTARVEVDRLWRLVFGAGLVRTPEDFGLQGTPPTHPELLDALALDLVESGWDRRALLRRLTLSATYRQASRPSERARRVDPDNLWLSHVSRRRLGAEMLRDAALANSGLLVRRLGGPPVRPYQPPGLWREVSGATYREDTGEGLWRRSLYTIWKRTAPPPAMLLMDAAGRDVCQVRRTSTLTPQQALLVWNDPQHVEAARALAQRVLRESSDDRVRLERAFRRWTSRRTTAAEADVLLELLEAQRGAYGADPAAARDLVSVGRAPRDESLDVAELAAWTVVVQTLQSLDDSLSLP